MAPMMIAHHNAGLSVHPTENFPYLNYECPTYEYVWGCHNGPCPNNYACFSGLQYPRPTWDSQESTIWTSCYTKNL